MSEIVQKDVLDVDLDYPKNLCDIHHHSPLAPCKKDIKTEFQFSL